MQRTLFLLLFVGSSLLTFTQNISITNHDFSIREQLSCPFSPGTSVLWPGGWTIYQTKNNSWDGPIDSTRCISGKGTTDSNDRFTIDLSQADPSRAIFIRQSFDGEAGRVLAENYIYQARMNAGTLPGDSLLVGNACENNVCSGLILVVDIPDESGTGTHQRINTASFSLPSSLSGYTSAESCLVTEYFPDGNVLRDIIIKVRFTDEHLETGLTLFNSRIYGPEIGDLSINLIEELVFPQHTFSGESYSANLHEVARPEPLYMELPYLFLHEEGVYPRPGNVTYIEGRPEVPTEEPVQLRAFFDFYQTIHFQPYTELRGALVRPDDTLRHQLTLVGEDIEWCFPSIVELVVGDGAELEFRSGNIQFAGPTSCIMLRDGGAISIPDNTRFVYGRGEGALGLDKGGTLNIGKGSELVINNTAILSNFVDGPDRQVYIELGPDSRLTFGEQSRLIRKGHVEDGHMLLNVFMKGGILDDSRLSERERRLINRIYPGETKSRPDWLRMLGNPTRHQLDFTVEASSAEIPVSWRMQDMNGRSLKSGKFQAMQGMNRREISVSDLAGGIYLLEVRQGAEREVRKFVVAP